MSQAQTTTKTEVRKFEVIAVDGNNLTVRNENGTQQYTVPDDFRFTIDGKKLSVKQLKPGMKGTATVTTTTTVWPVTVTEIKDGTVVSATDHSVNVRSAEGVRRFTQEQLDDRGVQILKDGKIVHIRDLRKGDQITATFISKEPPVVVTETEVQATLAPGASPPAAAAPAAAAPAAAAAAPTQPAAAPPAAAPPAARARQARARAAARWGNALDLVPPDRGRHCAAVVLPRAQEGKKADLNCIDRAAALPATDAGAFAARTLQSKLERGAADQRITCGRLTPQVFGGNPLSSLIDSRP